MTGEVKRKTFILFTVALLIFAAFFFAQKVVRSQNKSAALPVPFTTQAPDDNWDNNENCEEASLVMANAYFSGNRQDLVSKEDAQREINKVNDWEKNNLGHTANTGADEISKTAKEIYGLKAKIINDYSEQDLKKALQDNKLVILALRGQTLKNPNYIPPGPPYHVIILRGYNQNGFISNDPGTNDGKNYVYSFATLKNAAADWDNKNNRLDTSKKPAIILSK